MKLNHFDNENINNNKQYIVKFSNDTQNPICIYVRVVVKEDTLTITYRTSSENLVISIIKHHLLLKILLTSLVLRLI